MLTYETIRNIIDQEKSSEKLAKIPDNFFIEARNYLHKKAKMSKDDEWRVESAKRRLQDIIDLREKKIASFALYATRSNIKPENMTEDEERLFNSIISSLKSFRSGIEKAMDIEHVEYLVSIKSDIDSFVGINMNVYGPLKKGDIITLPKPNAELLIKKNVAEKIEVG